MGSVPSNRGTSRFKQYGLEVRIGERVLELDGNGDEVSCGANLWINSSSFRVMVWNISVREK